MKRVSSGVVSVWVRFVPKPENDIQKILEERERIGFPLKKGLKNIGYSHLFIKLNCKERKMRIVQEKIFNSKGFLLSAYFVPPQWKILNQDSFPSDLSNIVCPNEYIEN